METHAKPERLSRTVIYQSPWVNLYVDSATDGTSWELPAGYVEEGESITEAATREVLEETGYRSTDGELVYSYYPINGMSNQVFHIVRCRATEIAGEFDTGEVLEVRAFSKEEIWQMVRNRAITHGLTLTSVLLCVQGYVVSPVGSSDGH